MCHVAWDLHRALGIVLLKGPRGSWLLVSEVPLKMLGWGVYRVALLVARVREGHLVWGFEVGVWG